MAKRLENRPLHLEERCHLSEKALRAFADDALKKLDDGESEPEVKEWADSRVLAEDA